jgi:two-component system chemotaxis response regulator CheY
MDEDILRIYEAFVEESREEITGIEEGLLKLEHAYEDTNLVRSIFRYAHNIKGNSASLGLDKLSGFIHHYESLLDRILQGGLKPDKKLINVLLKGVDLLKEVIDAFTPETPPGDQHFDYSRCDELVKMMENYKEVSAGNKNPVGKKVSAGNKTPVGPPVSDAAERAPAEEEPKAEKTRPRFLIVEDDLISRKVMSSILAKYGDYDIAVNGREAIEAFFAAFCEQKPYDVMFLDVKMPVMSGEEALKAIRSYETDMGIPPREEIKVVMTTSVDEPKEIMHIFYKGGCNDYIVKPVSKAKLVGLLKKYGVTSE